MKIAPFSIADYCEFTDGMPHDAERLFFRMLLKMYSREGGLPDSDADNARIFGYDLRVYRRLKTVLLKWPDAIFIEASEIRNSRAEKDIAEAAARKKLAAENGKIGGKSKGLRANFAPTSGKLPPDFDEKSYRIAHTTNGEINNLAEPSPSPTPSPTPKEKESAAATVEQVAAPPGADDLKSLYGRLVSAANGALDNPVNCQGLLNTAVPQMWLRNGCDLELDVIPTLEAAGVKHCGKRIRDWSYFSGMVAETKAKRERGLPTVTIGSGSPAGGRMAEFRTIVDRRSKQASEVPHG